MKLTSAFCTLALATAADDSQGAQADSQGAKSQGAQADSQGAKSQGAQPQGSGYGDQAESYGNEGYAEQSYGEAVSYGFKAKELCLGACPREAPCQHKGTGACVAKLRSYVQHEAYGEQSYGAQQSYGGAQQQQGYRGLQEEGGGSCPYGTVDTSCGSLNNHIVLWVAFALLFLPSMWFFCNAFGQIIDPATGQPIVVIAATAPSILKYRLHRVIAGAICFIASLAYLAMATGHGYTVRCCDGRQFYYARYVDWAITTPLLLWEIIDYTNAPVNQRFFMYAADVLMIIAGLIGSLVCGGEKWIFFGFSMLCFIPILWFLCALRETVELENLKAFETLMNITVISWFFYPIIWILAEGTGTLCANAEAICYTVLDIIAKSAFGFVVCNHPIQMMLGAVGPPTAAGSSML